MLMMWIHSLQRSMLAPKLHLALLLRRLLQRLVSGAAAAWVLPRAAASLHWVRAARRPPARPRSAAHACASAPAGQRLPLSAPPPSVLYCFGRTWHNLPHTSLLHARRGGQKWGGRRCRPPAGVLAPSLLVCGRRRLIDDCTKPHPPSTAHGVLAAAGPSAANSPRQTRPESIPYR